MKWILKPYFYSSGPRDDRDNLDTEQGMGGPLGQLEGRQVHGAWDQQHGDTVYDHLQEAHEILQRPQGLLISQS